MPLRDTMANIRLDCQRQADKESDGSIATAEWNRLISRRYAELYTIVAQSGMRYFETVLTYTTTGAASYDEPADHYETVGVCRVLDTTRGTRRDLFELMAQERSRYSGMTGDAVAYALVDDQMYFYPTPQSGQTYELVYVPQPPDLSAYADSDVVDLVVPDGRNFLVWAVAVDALGKSESDVQLAMSEREGARTRLTEEATLRALNNPRRRQVRIDNSGYDGRGYDDGLLGSGDPSGWWNR